VLLIIGTSLGRVYLGVHWPSDVLCGLLLSSAWLTFGNSITLPQQKFDRPD
jgi:membrane-associated phospholipid phosphatase